MTEFSQNEITLTSDNWEDVFWQFVDVVPILKNYLMRYLRRHRSRLGPDWVEAVSSFLGQVTAEKPDEALRIFEQRLTSFPPNGWLSLYAADILCYKKADYFKARLLYRQAEAEIPEFPKVHLDLGLIFMLLTDWNRALAAYEKTFAFAENDPKNAEDLRVKALFNQAIIYANYLHDVPRAAGLLRRTLAIRPDYELARRALKNMKQSMV